MSAAEMNRMLQEGLTTDDAWAAISRLDPAYVARFELTEEERTALDAPDPPTLASIGVHPMLAMWGTFMRVPEFAKSMSAGEYFTGFSSKGEE